MYWVDYPRGAMTLLSDPDIVQLSNELKAEKKPIAEKKFQLAKLYHDRGDFEESVQLLLDIETEHPDFLHVYVALGDVCLEGELYEQAYNHYRTVYHTQPELLDRAALIRFALCASTWVQKTSPQPYSKLLSRNTLLMYRLTGFCSGSMN